MKALCIAILVICTPLAAAFAQSSQMSATVIRQQTEAFSSLPAIFSTVS
ncbi:hypothetical protein SAMN04487976_13514 [Xaviernesmea oryzae]|nr:hypothetical protein SAMN04487976_13514 [Xaviernesmea oryzae]